jgi:hypothetical protein
VAAPRTSLYKRSLLPDMVAGTAWRPYVKRVLVPLAVRGTDALLPAAVRSGIEAQVRLHPILTRRLGWQSEHASWYVLVFMLHGLSLFGFALAFRRLARRTFELDGVTASLAAAGALALLPIHFGYQNFVYDFPDLALFTLGLAFIAAGERTRFYLLWPLGLLNKETFVLLVPLFALRERERLPRGGLLAHAGVQLALAAGVWLALGWTFRHNPGAPLEWQLPHNLTHHPSTRQLLHDLVYWGAWVGGLCFWRQKRQLAGAALVVIGALVAITFFFGFMGEYRAFYEAWPLLALLLTHTALRLLGRAPGAHQLDPAGPELRQVRRRGWDSLRLRGPSSRKG